MILHISDKRWIPALVVHCGSEAVPFRAPHVSTDLKSQVEQDTSGAHVQQP